MVSSSWYLSTLLGAWYLCTLCLVSTLLWSDRKCCEHPDQSLPNLSKSIFHCLFSCCDQNIFIFFFNSFFLQLDVVTTIILSIVLIISQPLHNNFLFLQILKHVNSTAFFASTTFHHF